MTQPVLNNSTCLGFRVFKHYRDVCKCLVYNDELTLKERWDMAKRTIEHEHNIIKTRSNRFLTLQGFLFTMSVALISAYFYNEYQNPWISATYFFSLFVASILLLIYWVAISLAIILIDAVDLAKRHTYYASYWFDSWSKVKKDEEEYVSEPNKKCTSYYWLPHHAQPDLFYDNQSESYKRAKKYVDSGKRNADYENSREFKNYKEYEEYEEYKNKNHKAPEAYEKTEAYIKLKDRDDFKLYLDNIARKPDDRGVLMCGLGTWLLLWCTQWIRRLNPIHELLKKFVLKHWRVAEYKGRGVDHKLGGTSIGYARLLINAWGIFFAVIIGSIIIHVYLSYKSYNLGMPIAPPIHIAVSNLQEWEKKDKTWVKKPVEPFQHEDKTPLVNDKAVELEKSAKPNVTFHLFENVKIEFHLNQPEKLENQPVIFYDSIDRLFNRRLFDLLKTPCVPDKSVPDQCVPETSADESG